MPQPKREQALNHFILTRFNLRLWWNEDKNHQPIQTDEWLKERFRLFQTYTWPSLKAQTNQDFKWICLFDKDTPNQYKEQIQQLQRQWDSFLPYYCGEKETKQFQRYFKYLVYSNSDKTQEPLLTTYLDNDDALHKDFIKDVQERAKKLQYNTIISYQYGIQYYEEMNIAIRIPYKNNHFLTYYERFSDHLRTVWDFWHISIFKYPHIAIELIDNKKTPLWIETIHKGNIDNDVKMTIHHHLITRKDFLYDCGINISLERKTTSWCRFISMFIPRFLKQIIRRGTSKLHSKRKIKNGTH